MNFFLPRNRKSLSPLLLLLSLAPACESKPKADQEPPQKTEAAAPPLATRATGTAEKATSTARCPNGEWIYNYSKNALDVVRENFSDAKVRKAEGQLVCKIDTEKLKEITCTTTSPVHIIVSLGEGSSSLSIEIKMSGTSSAHLSIINDKEMKVTSSDLGKMKTSLAATLGNTVVPFPAANFFSVFPPAQSTIEYKCTGGGLSFKAQDSDSDSLWQSFTAR